MTTVEEIRQLAQAMQEAYDEWEEQLDEDEPQPPDAGLWTPIEAFLAGFDREVFPAAAEAVKKLNDRYEHFNVTGEAFPDDLFWGAFKDALAECNRTAPKIAFPPSIKELKEQKVSDAQIAVIWMLKKPDGHPDHAAVQQETAEPGSVITEAYKEAWLAKRLADEGWGPPAKKQMPKREPVKIAPNMTDLVRQRVSVNQIVRMVADHYHVFEQPKIELIRNAVHNVAAVLEIKLPEHAQESLNEAGQELTERQYGKAYVDRPMNGSPIAAETVVQDETAPTDDVEGHVEAEVIGMSERGSYKNSKEMVDDISTQLELSRSQVRRIIAQHKAQFEQA